MRIILNLNYHSLAHLAPLFAKLHTQYPNGWVFFDVKNATEVQPVLDVQPHQFSQEDKAFLDDLRQEHLISFWLRDSTAE